jgi:hypothetical protein
VVSELYPFWTEKTAMNGKKCLLIYPDGKQQYHNKSTKSIGFELSELELYLNQLNKSASNQCGGRYSRSGPRIGTARLVYYSSTYQNLPVNITSKHDDCTCGLIPPHEFHGTIGLDNKLTTKTEI